MRCPRLDHFVRFNTNGTVSRCGHMVNAPRFDTLADMENSMWLAKTKEKMQAGEWPAECVRCREVEAIGPSSVRIHAIALDEGTSRRDYLQVGGVLDNLCNAACMTCNANHSSRIGALESQTFSMVNNSQGFWSLPQERIVHLDINGGEPSYSKNYKYLLKNLPPNLRTLRLNTNGATVLTELVDIANNGIEVTVTMSCDGVGPTHDLLRWPIPWKQFVDNMLIYQSMPVKLNLWTTVSKLNQHDLVNIQNFAKEHNVDHAYAYLKEPWELSVDNPDDRMTESYINRQKQLRGID